MGCFGIGVSRVLAAAVELSHDARGIVWPPAMAPYRVCVVARQNQDGNHHPKWWLTSDAAEAVYDALQALPELAGEVVLDTRGYDKAWSGLKSGTVLWARR